MIAQIVNINDTDWAGLVKGTLDWQGWLGWNGSLPIGGLRVVVG